VLGRLHVAAIVPALDEELVIGQVVSGLRALATAEGPLIDRVIVVDNGSRDRTAERAAATGAVVVHEPQRGYGGACLRGIAAAAEADVIIFVDGDGSCDPQDGRNLLEAIGAGADLSIGVRIPQRREPRALTAPQAVGNRIAVAMIRMLWGVRYRDLGPYRAIRTEALHRLRMRDRSFGWTVEMQVRAITHGLHVCEVPVRTRRRIGVSKISGTWRGVLGAAKGIIGTILRLRFEHLRSARGAAFDARGRDSLLIVDEDTR
jgi:glycosyltransferase involved in cell wall biosynthesis